MFNRLTDSFTKIFDKLRNKGLITEEHINTALRDIRIALLEADVSLEVIKDFINNIKTKCLGVEIIKSITPVQLIIKIVNDELIRILECDQASSVLLLKNNAINNILMVGLQGSGKTTSSAKLALHLKKSNKKRLLVSIDVYRPAAIDQLKRLADSISIDFFESESNIPLEIVKQAQSFAKPYDVVIYDSAGRLHIETEMMQELKEIKKIILPQEVLLVIDSIMGQDAINVAQEFNKQLDITGLILTKLDGDNRGGAVLSAKYITKKPIKFIGIGEKLSGLEYFYPDRLASRILGMGDVVSLVEQIQKNIDHESMEKSLDKFSQGKFDLSDYLNQLKNIKKIGGLSNVLGMLPGNNKLKTKLPIDDLLIEKQQAIINSMNKLERKNPKILNASRKKRIAAGSGTSVQEINRLLKQFTQAHQVVKQVSGGSKKDFLKNISKLF